MIPDAIVAPPTLRRDEFELELIQTHMTQKSNLLVEAGAVS
jgi:hypothetical protein